MTPLLLRKVTGVDAGGVPVLDGDNRRIVAVQRFAQSHVGQQAVCQPAASEEDTLVVLGVLDDTPVDDAPQPLILQCGEASLTLAPDGSIRLEGGDFGLRVRDTVRITGAVIDLN